MRRSAIPSSSQTVGPYFRIGLEYLIDERMADVDAARVRSRFAEGFSTGMARRCRTRCWSFGMRAARAMLKVQAQRPGIPDGFRRVGDGSRREFHGTACEGRLTNPSEDGRVQAPHMMVLVFARGLQRHLISRVYLEDEPGNENDPVLLSVPAERRAHTDRAKCDGAKSYRWDVILQGADETVFFAW